MATFRPQAAESSVSLFKTILYSIIQPVLLGLIVLFAFGLLGATLLAAFGVMPWLEVPVTINGAAFEAAGMWAQIGFTVLVLALCAFVPTNGRVMQLEHSHRKFHLTMNDIVHAYHTAHAADRQGAFSLSHEFDAVRERIAYLREHPDLQSMEPEILEAAAQMSTVSRDLADTYSDERVNRAREFLRQRQQELEDFKDRIDTAKILTEEMRQWVQAVEIDEAVAQSQVNRLKADLNDILPELDLGLAELEARRGKTRTDPERPDNVVGIAKTAAE
ncbi:DNA repair protein [Lutimaribacter marinistellae]|uniref:DNA repair protein n=1 Tax=Lutimaribacter marinistellae TaxID=1820329 RepID=A0ABV7TMT5_9RHOB